MKKLLNLFVLIAAIFTSSAAVAEPLKETITVNGNNYSFPRKLNVLDYRLAYYYQDGKYCDFSIRSVIDEKVYELNCWSFDIAAVADISIEQIDSQLIAIKLDNKKLWKKYRSFKDRYAALEVHNEKLYQQILAVEVLIKNNTVKIVELQDTKKRFTAIITSSAVNKTVLNCGIGTLVESINTEIYLDCKQTKKIQH